MRRGSDLQPLFHCMPFGCAVIYLRDVGSDRYMPHFAPRGTLGLFMGYSTGRTILVLDAQMFARRGLRSIAQTRDVVLPRGEFVYPLRQLNKYLDPISDWSLEAPAEVAEPCTDEEGHEVCVSCCLPTVEGQLLVLHVFVACPCEPGLAAHPKRPITW